MARKNRIEYPGAFFHVLARGNNKQKIFKDEEDYKVYILRLKKYYERHKFILYAYVLMPNHVHLLIETGLTPLSKIMQGLQQSYTYYFHRKYKTVGHLFQGRYKAILCQRDTYLLELVRYIHLNPVRAGLATNPEDYLWSSHLVYIGYLNQNYVKKDLVLKILSGNEPKSDKIYCRFIADVVDKGHQNAFYDMIDQRLLGSSDFVNEVKQRIKGQDKNKNHNQKQFIQEQRDQVLIKKKTLPEILEAVIKIMRVSSESILSNSREQKIASARRLYAFIASRYSGISNKSIAEFLKKDHSHISNMIRKIEEDKDCDIVLSEYLDKIIHVLKV